MNPTPILYSFRRCPYAMRARLGIYYSGLQVELREVILKDKPLSMLEYSPKGTVPVLVLNDGEIIDESIDIVRWALAEQDPFHLLPKADSVEFLQSNQLIDQNDFEFKEWLDRYKYADRHPEFSESYYREKSEKFLAQLDQLLSENGFLFGNTLSVSDIAIAPFIRQFANVDRKWFDQSPYSQVQRWLASIIESKAFENIFNKYPQWQPDDEPMLFSAPQ